MKKTCAKVALRQSKKGISAITVVPYIEMDFWTLPSGLNAIIVMDGNIFIAKFKKGKNMLACKN